MKQLEESKITVSGIEYKTVYTPDNGQLGVFRLSPGTSRELQYGYIQSNGGAFYYDVKTRQGNTNAKNIAALQSDVSKLNGYAPVVQNLSLKASLWRDNKLAITGLPVIGENPSVIVSPIPEAIDLYIASGIRCVGASGGEIGFVCTTTPTEDIGVSVMVFNGIIIS